MAKKENMSVKSDDQLSSQLGELKREQFRRWWSVSSGG